MIKYYSAWFCPFAHRATLALEYHGVKYEWIEALGWEKRDASGEENFDAGERKDWWYHWKHEDLLKANPDGMVPTLVAEDGRVATESITCLQVIDAIGRSDTRRLVDVEDPWSVARHQNWAAKVNKTCCSEYYSVLVREDGREESFQRLVDGLKEFSDEGLSEGGGPFFGGRSQPGIVDLTLLPYAYRFYVLDHYRGFKIPSIPPYDRWLSSLLEIESLRKTMPDKARYLKHIEKYASGKARSKVANAVRRGVKAHDYEHSKD